MPMPILTTKLYITPPQPKVVLRPRLIERLNQGLNHNLTLISAPAGFGKTTLVSSWINDLQEETTSQEKIANHRSKIRNRVTWLSLDKGDNDPKLFLTYLVTALQKIAENIGKGVLAGLQSPQPPPIESILTTLLNEITTVQDNFILVLDDYHVIDSKPVDNALTFLLEHLPPQMHLVIATREDPQLPLARLRVRGQLTELRASDLRFTPSEAAEFLNQVMVLNLTEENIAALETRTEGWIAGLQLAAISMQGQEDASSFIKSFTGSNHFVLDYLVEEVLQQQSENVQTFLLRTSILDRLCGPLCDAVLGTPASSGQETLEYLEHANLFIVPLDDERRWYRYHHLFADLLRQRLQQSAASFTENDEKVSDQLHIRASIWYEENGLEIEAFHQAVAANDVERAERLMEGDGMPLPFRGAVLPVLNWLSSLPTTVLDARPLLWVTYASTFLATGRLTGVEEKLQAAEVALQDIEQDDKTQDIVGRIAATRATMAVGQNQVETIIAQSHRALEFLHPHNLAFRTSTTWKLGYAYHFQGNRTAASKAYTEAMSIGQASGNIIFTASAKISLGCLQEVENQLNLAVELFQRALQLFGDQPLPAMACEAHLGLARIFYERNELDVAQQCAQESAQLLQQVECNDTFATCDLFLARLKLAQGDVTGASAILTKTSQFVHRHNFVNMMPEIAAAQVLMLLHQDNLAAAADLVEKHELPISQARLQLAQGDTSAALTILNQFRQQVEARGWQDQQLKVMILQAVTLYAHGEKDKALQMLGEALALAEPEGFIRIFVDEGELMKQPLSEAFANGVMPDYTGKLLAGFKADELKSEEKSYLPPALPNLPLIEPLSKRELEVLQLIAKGLSNPEISKRLFIALPTVKGHNLKIFAKLNVQNRTEAVARARELGLLE